MGKRANGEGSIYRRKDGRWVGSLVLPTGGRKDIYGKTQKEVLEKLETAKGLRIQGRLLSDQKLTMSEFLDFWLDHIDVIGLKPKTLAAYTLCTRRITDRIGRMRLEALRASHLDKCYKDLLDEGLSRRSVEQTHTVMHTALEHAVRQDLIARNPAHLATAPRPDRSEMRCLTEDQVQRLFRATKEDRLHALWVVLITTGLRVGEATGLRWSDVDLDARTITIKRSLQRVKSEGLKTVDVKTHRSRRKVHIPAGTRAALDAHRMLQKRERPSYEVEHQDSDFVFMNKIGGPIDPGNVHESFQRRLKRAGLPPFRVHDCRHTCASLLLAKGVNPKVVQEMLGHSTITITLNTYSHVLPAMHEQAASHMDSLFTSEPTSGDAH